MWALWVLNMYLACSNEATCSQRNVIITYLTPCGNKLGHAPLTLNSDGLMSLLRISKLDTDLYSTCVLPWKELDRICFLITAPFVKFVTAHCYFKEKSIRLVNAGSYLDHHTYHFRTICAITLALVLNRTISLTPLLCRYFRSKCERFKCKATNCGTIVMQPCCGS